MSKTKWLSSSRRREAHDIRDFIPVHGKILRPHGDHAGQRSPSSSPVKARQRSPKKQPTLTQYCKKEGAGAEKAPASRFSTGVRRKDLTGIAPRNISGHEEKENVDLGGESARSFQDASLSPPPGKQDDPLGWLPYGNSPRRPLTSVNSAGGKAMTRNSEDTALTLPHCRAERVASSSPLRRRKRAHSHSNHTPPPARKYTKLEPRFVSKSASDKHQLQLGKEILFQEQKCFIVEEEQHLRLPPRKPASKRLHLRRDEGVQMGQASREGPHKPSSSLDLVGSAEVDPQRPLVSMGDCESENSPWDSEVDPQRPLVSMVDCESENSPWDSEVDPQRPLVSMGDCDSENSPWDSLTDSSLPKASSGANCDTDELLAELSNCVKTI